MAMTTRFVAHSRGGHAAAVVAAGGYHARALATATGPLLAAASTHAVLRTNTVAACVRCLHSSSSPSFAAAASSSSSSSSRRARSSSGAPPVPASTTTALPSGSGSFTALQVAPFLGHRLAAGGIHRPTVIQSAAIPHLLRRPWDAATYPDLLVQEMTGQGKTLSYLLPILSTIDRSIAAVQAIIVVPTRELAVQVSRVAQELGGNVSGAKPMPYPLCVTTLVGQVNPTMLSTLARSAGFEEPQLLADEGVDRSQMAIGQHHPHLLVATPQVLHEIFVQRKLTDVHAVLPLTHLKYLVFDEADALLNAASSRNLIVPLIQLRHQATALTLDRIKEEQAQLDATRAERRANKKKVEGFEEEVDEVFDENAVPPMPKEFQQEQEEERQRQQQKQNQSAAAAEPSPLTLPALTSTFPRNQVVLVSATVTAAVHQFAARYLSQSRAFITNQSVAQALAKSKASQSKDGSSSTGESDALTVVPTTPATAVQRIPSHIKHYYLVVNRPYDRLNSLQQLLQAIKLQFDAWKRAQLAGGEDEIGSSVGAGSVLQKPPSISASWLKKHMGPERALSAGGTRRTNEVSRTRFLKGGVSAMGLGAGGHFKQSSLVFVEGREGLAQLVNPLSQQGFQLGVVSEQSGRHERREALRLEKTELLLATDVLARGMDLKSLTHVVNYTPPPTPNVYLHRAGRVGRLGAVHAKLGSVITLVDLQADARALEHLSKVAGALGGGLEFKRIYVKKGKLFEDAAEVSRITADHVPTIEEFVADKSERPTSETETTTKTGVRLTHREKKEHSQRLQLGGAKKSNKKKSQAAAATASASTSSASDAASSTYAASTASASRTSSSSGATTPAAANVPADPIGAHLRLTRQDLSSPSRLAELELASPAPSRKQRTKNRQV